MVITQAYLALLILAVGLTLLIWAMDSCWLEKHTSPGAFKRMRNVGAFFLLLIILYLCYLNFPVTLTALTAATGIIALVDWLFFRRRRKAQGRSHPLIVDNAYS